MQTQDAKAEITIAMKQGSVGRTRRRIDLVLVERGLTPSREKAQAVILAGLVRVSGVRVDKPGTQVSVDAEVSLVQGPRFVGRGGDKLDGALELLGIDVRGIAALDAGASTGGFTDCLLQRGAASVVAVDVGHGQLDWGIRNDPRVAVFEGLNIRYLEPGAIAGPFDLVVADLSFISLRLVLPVLFPRLRPVEDAPAPAGPSHPREESTIEPRRDVITTRPITPQVQRPLCRLPGLLALVKPQFEAGRGEVGKGGIIRDPEIQRTAIVSVVEAVSGPAGNSFPSQAPSAREVAPEHRDSPPERDASSPERYASSLERRVSSTDPRATSAGHRASSLESRDSPPEHPGYGAVRIIESLPPGAEGNREFFVYFREGRGLEGDALRNEAGSAVAGAPRTHTREDANG